MHCDVKSDKIYVTLYILLFVGIHEHMIEPTTIPVKVNSYKGQLPNETFASYFCYYLHFPIFRDVKVFLSYLFPNVLVFDTSDS